MGRTLRGVMSSLLVGSLVLGLAGPAGAALTDQERAERATGFIASQQRANGSFPAFSAIGSTADAVLAFVAAGIGRREARDALAYLERQVEKGNVTAEGLKSKVLLAWTSAGRGGRTIGGVNLVRELRNLWSDGLTHTVYDTALTVLALRSSGATVPAPAIALLQAERCPDGGWAYDGFNEGEDQHCQGAGEDWYASDTNTTALAVMALQATEPTKATALNGTSPWTFFESLRDETYGGWGYTWGFETTDANSTGLVLQAYAAAGLATPPGARKALRHLQYGRCGAFAFTWEGDTKGAPDLGATIGAVPGLLRLPFPYTGTIEGPAPRLPACPG